jgi:hypothetical protein
MEKNIKKKSNLSTFIIIFIIIFFLGLISYWRMKEFEQRMAKIEMPEFEMPEIKIPPLETIENFEIPKPEFLFPQQPQKDKDYQVSEKLKYHKFISPDGNLEIKYSPKKWKKAEKVFLEHINRELKRENIEILFLAQKDFNFLGIQKLYFEEKPTIENVIKKLKEDAKTREAKIEIINLEVKDFQARFEAKHKEKRQTVKYSKEKILLSNNKVYLITTLTSKENWPGFKKEAEKILNSARLITNSSIVF